MIYRLSFLLLLSMVACLPYGGPYLETFEQNRGNWPEENNAEAVGQLVGGGYELEVKAANGIFWVTGGDSFGDGTYQVEATQVAGTLDNGYGLIFMVDAQAGDFYAFEVSGDGYIWLGRCQGGCGEDLEVFVGEGWVESAAVNQDLQATNTLRVVAEQGNMTFFVNDQEVGQTFNTVLTRGEIGLLVETLGEGGVKVRFDNVRYTPSEG